LREDVLLEYKSNKSLIDCETYKFKQKSCIRAGLF